LGKKGGEDFPLGKRRGTRHGGKGKRRSLRSSGGGKEGNRISNPNKKKKVILGKKKEGREARQFFKEKKRLQKGTGIGSEGGEDREKKTTGTRGARELWLELVKKGC